MLLRTVRIRRVLNFPTQCNSLIPCLPVYVPIVAGHSYATKKRTLRFDRGIINKDDTTKDYGERRWIQEHQIKAMFTLEDVPSLAVLEAMLQHPAAPAYLKGMTAAQGRGLLTEYARRKLEHVEALRTKSQGVLTEHNRRCEAPSVAATKWPWVLEGLLQDDAANKPAVLATLHSLACVLLFTPEGRQWAIALDILRWLGYREQYAPSELTLVRLAHAADRMDRPMFAPAIERVTTGRLLCETDSDRANYETLRGLICASSAPTEKAARDALWWFQRALDPQKGRRAPGAFDWQAACMVEMGRCYTRVGDARNANKVWEMAARELDSPEATSLFATAAMDERDPRAEEWLTRAALGGQRSAQAGLAKIQKAKWEDAESKGIKGWELTFRKLMKDEWETLAHDMPQAR